jgi:hypothetical protein
LGGVGIVPIGLVGALGMVVIVGRSIIRVVDIESELLFRPAGAGVYSIANPSLGRNTV